MARGKPAKVSEGIRLVRAAIAKRGWTQNELARQVGTSSGLVSRWMRGDQNPDIRSAMRIADLLGIALERFAEDARESVRGMRAAG